MTEPTLALQIAIRARLIGSASVTDLVAPLQIRDGAARPDAFPSIILGEGQTTLAGDRYEAIRNVWAYLNLDVWTQEQGLSQAKAIVGAVCDALGTELGVPGFALTDGIHIDDTHFMRDPRQEHGHGVIMLRAFMECPT
jgi:hypothetical protein